MARIAMFLARSPQPPMTGRKAVINTALEALAREGHEVDLFIMARPHGMKTGTPLAVKRVIGLSFPYDYSIGQADTMLPDVEFDGAVTLLFRLDNDGNLKSTPGDMEGEVNAMAGDTNVTAVMDTIVGG